MGPAGAALSPPSIITWARPYSTNSPAGRYLGEAIAPIPSNVNRSRTAMRVSGSTP
jgi:hypothetical protein